MIERFFNSLKYIFTNPLFIKVSNDKKEMFLYFIYFQIIIFLINIFAFGVCELFDVNPNSNITEITFFNVVVLAPVIEECMFRAILKKKFINYFLFIIASVYFFRFQLNENIYIISAIIIVFTLLLLLLNKNNFFDNNYTNLQLLFVVYISSISFGIAHVGNYTFSTKIILFLIIMSLSKIISGFLRAMFRLKFGFFYSIILHIFTNLVGFSAHYFSIK